MTTIAVRDGVMAADTQGQETNKLCRAKKLFRLSNGGIVGFSGVWTDGKLFVDWYDAGANIDEPPKWRIQDGEIVDFNALVLKPSGTYLWSYNLVEDEMLDAFWAIGSGSAAALAAMYLGCGAESAVNIAMKVDPLTGGCVEIMRLAK